MAVLIDPTSFQAQPFNNIDAGAEIWSRFCGPHEYNGNLYMVLEDSQLAASAFNNSVFVSTDSGVTWSVLSAASPTTGNAASPPPGSDYTTRRCEVAFNGSKVWLLYWTTYPSVFSGTINGLKLNYYDIDSNAWGSEFTMTAVPSAPSPDIRMFNVSAQSDGIVNVVYSHNDTGSVFKVGHVRFDSGSSTWGSHSRVTTTNAYIQSGFIFDPATDTTHVFLTERDVFGTGGTLPVIHVAIDSTGTLSSETTVQAVPYAAADTWPSFGQGCIWNDTIVAPYSNHATHLFSVYLGTPVSSPVWTSVNIPILDDPDGQYNHAPIYPFIASAVGQDGSLNVFYPITHWDPDFDFLNARLLTHANTGSGFGAETVLYDTDGDNTISPSVVQNSNHVSIVLPSVALLTTGQFGFTFQVALNTTGTYGYNVLPNVYLSTGTGGGTFIPWRVIVDLYGDTQLSALEPAGTPLAVIT